MTDTTFDLTAMTVNYVQGIDISPHQADIDWSAVASTHLLTFCYVKGSEGNGWKSPTYRSQVENATKIGLSVGLYHYAREALSDPIKAARFHHSLASALPITLTHALDLEWDTDEKTMTEESLFQWAQSWLTEITQLTGKAPIIYTSSGYLQEKMPKKASALATHHPLWCAGYPWDKAATANVLTDPLGVTQPSYHPKIAESMGPKQCRPWNYAHIWQWTGKGQIAGIKGHVDRNVSHPQALADLVMMGCP